jgi:hypothetical protein
MSLTALMFLASLASLSSQGQCFYGLNLKIDEESIAGPQNEHRFGILKTRICKIFKQYDFVSKLLKESQFKPSNSLNDIVS